MKIYLKELQKEEQERKETSLEEISSEATERMNSEELEKLERRLEDDKKRLETEIQQQKENNR